VIGCLRRPRSSVVEIDEGDTTAGDGNIFAPSTGRHRSKDRENLIGSFEKVTGRGPLADKVLRSVRRYRDEATGVPLSSTQYPRDDAHPHPQPRSGSRHRLPRDCRPLPSRPIWRPGHGTGDILKQRDRAALAAVTMYGVLLVLALAGLVPLSAGAAALPPLGEFHGAIVSPPFQARGHLHDQGGEEHGSAERGGDHVGSRRDIASRSSCDAGPDGCSICDLLTPSTEHRLLLSDVPTEFRSWDLPSKRGGSLGPLRPSQVGMAWRAREAQTSDVGADWGPRGPPHQQG
jgi:hypothetical protein